MPAPTLEELFDFETEIEGVFVSYLATVLSIPAGGSDQNVTLTTPRMSVIATIAEHGTHQYTITTGIYSGRSFYDQFRASIQIDITYDPSFSQGQGSLRGKLRKALTDYYGIKTGFNERNDYLLIAPDSFRQTGGNRTIDEDNNEETISTTLECVFFVNPNAIPQTDTV